MGTIGLMAKLSEVDSMTVTVYRLAFGALLLWLWMLLIGLFPGLLGLTLAVYAIRRLSSASYATISCLEPVTALILGWIVFSEHLSEQQLLGATVIIVNSLFELYLSGKRLVPVTSPAVR